ncbi:hypothetical protein B5K08_14405 [Rhizobium leguminosarum bv. trifolii]|uniref:Lytic murein transglycosylase n=1 Tax=Rhizobium leguminosarum bv. trifolii TaxID=386 RepID=A0A3E1BJT2_RHILT|nr:hypothetical protein B5K08_14405 [Rhizobium leguminosarum bv. trifolii]RFB93132.1 hypothetical protein B5K10_14400 [Rhizobium leguminosarum bv. trifolii]
MLCRARVSPLWPAGHLPHRWGDRQVAKPSRPSTVSAFVTFVVLRRPYPQPISPPVGEMPGRAEGGLHGMTYPAYLPPLKPPTSSL